MQLIDQLVIKKTQNQAPESPRNNHELIGKSEAIQDLRRIIKKVKQNNLNIIIHGETGTGKEIVARMIRKALPSNLSEPFVAVDSSTIQSTIAESMLFGHERGAFTGADRQQKGLFEQANGGIIYFDEIGNMPLDIQAKLLRVIQEKEIRRIGGTITIPLKFRIIVATNKNLDEMVKKGEFKEDLYQRLNVIPISIKPLKERVEDIPVLIEHFLNQDICNKNELIFSNEAVRVLEEYPWSGNIRELKNMVGYVATMTDGDIIKISDLSNDIQKFATSSNFSQTKQGKEFFSENKTFYDRVVEFEKKYLIDVYTKENGKISTISRKLQMDRSHLTQKLIEFGIHSPKPKRKNIMETSYEVA